MTKRILLTLLLLLPQHGLVGMWAVVSCIVNSKASMPTRSLLESLPLDNGKTLLHNAALWKDNQEAKQLLEADKKFVHAKDANGRTPVFFATMSGNLKGVELLIGYGADLTVVDKFGWTLLHIAASCGDKGLIQYLAPLLKLNVDQEDKTGETALMKAARAGHSGVVHLLVNDHKAAVNHVNLKNGRTALHIAAERDFVAKEIDPENVGPEATAIVLVRAGANPLLPDNNGVTAYALASPGLQKIFKRLMNERQEKEIKAAAKGIQKLRII